MRSDTLTLLCLKRLIFKWWSIFWYIFYAFIPYGTIFLQSFYKTWLWYNCRLAILRIDFNTVKVTGLTSGYLSNKKSERKGSEREASSCKLQGYTIKESVWELFRGRNLDQVCNIKRKRLFTLNSLFCKSKKCITLATLATVFLIGFTKGK